MTRTGNNSGENDDQFSIIVWEATASLMTWSAKWPELGASLLDQEPGRSGKVPRKPPNPSLVRLGRILQIQFPDEIRALKERGLHLHLKACVEKGFRLSLEMPALVKSSGWKEAWTHFDRIQTWLADRGALHSRYMFLNHLCVRKFNGHSWDTLAHSINIDLRNCIRDETYFPRRNGKKRFEQTLTDLGFSRDEIARAWEKGTLDLQKGKNPFVGYERHPTRKVPDGYWVQVLEYPVDRLRLQGILKGPWQVFKESFP